MRVLCIIVLHIIFASSSTASSWSDAYHHHFCHQHQGQHHHHHHLTLSIDIVIIRLCDFCLVIYLLPAMWSFFQTGQQTLTTSCALLPLACFIIALSFPFVALECLNIYYFCIVCATNSSKCFLIFKRIKQSDGRLQSAATLAKEKNFNLVFTAGFLY